MRAAPSLEDARFPDRDEAVDRLATEYASTLVEPCPPMGAMTLIVSCFDRSPLEDEDLDPVARFRVFPTGAMRRIEAGSVWGMV